MDSSSAPPTPQTPQIPPQGVSADEVLGLLAVEERQLIEKLVTYQDQYELPNEEDMKMLTVSSLLYIIWSGLGHI